VPKEWNIRDAYVKNSRGEKIIEFKYSNLHVVSYSTPLRKTVRLKELQEHLFTLPDHPEWIPYRTSYYQENWGFCLSQNQLSSIADGEYEVSIDASLQDGNLTYGEYFLEGQTDDEVLISTHVCHPSLANDNLSGVALAVFIAKYFQSSYRRYSYRFLFVPGTIGSITWLSLNESRISKIRHGVVLACLGDRGRVTYKKSRRGNAEIDRAALQVLKDSGDPFHVVEFSPYGYDERQFCSPGFNLPVGCFMRTPHNQFPEYHTSADNLEFVDALSLGDSFSKCMAILNVLEGNATYVNQNPKCEPQLGKRGLYQAIGGRSEHRSQEMAMLWVLNLSDGCSSLLDIAARSGMRWEFIKQAADVLLEHGLLQSCESSDRDSFR
jgi:aminopeptidase-like protein